MKTSYHDQLRADIRRMSRQSKLFKLLQKELSALGRWKSLGRGKPADPIRMRAVRSKQQPSGPEPVTPTVKSPVSTPIQRGSRDEYRQDEGLDW